ncbi:hypothetical protein LADH09A_000742 [Micromonospora sp. LAH09]|uniref:hypothetical protein n=1 Tax=Micromonospora cabrerizensis TaxID=2911213 RepID=UPI001EE89B9B|nr:hypothetical protein [Micromonospora cabrerizensis]MCG5472888.1 hypothetical protein [Micromonospora cabrerizensis]
MRELLASDLSLAATDLLADKKTPVSGSVTAIGVVIFLLLAVFLGYIMLKRRR